MKAIAAETDTEIMKIGKVFDVRWVASSSCAVNALWTDFPALFFHFSKLAEDGSIKSNERATFKGLATKLSTIQFIEDLALIRDCLSVLSELSATLQKRKTNMIVANKHIKWTIRSLQLIKQSLLDGKYSFQKIVGDGEKNSKVLGVALDIIKSRNYLSFNGSRFLDVIIESMRARLTDAAEPYLQSLRLLIPEYLPEDITIPWIEGEKELEELCNRFNVSKDGIRPAFREFLANPRQVPEFLKKKLINELVHMIPVSSAEAERGFSRMNLIANSSRGSLLVPNIDFLMFISINGLPHIHMYTLWDCTKSLKEWLKDHRSATDAQRREKKSVTFDELTPICTTVFCESITFKPLTSRRTEGLFK